MWGRCSEAKYLTVWVFQCFSAARGPETAFLLAGKHLKSTFITCDVWERTQHTPGISHSVSVYEIPMHSSSQLTVTYVDNVSLQHQCQKCLPWGDLELSNEGLMDGWMANKLGIWLCASGAQNDMGLIYMCVCLCVPAGKACPLFTERGVGGCRTQCDQRLCCWCCQESVNSGVTGDFSLACG